MKEKKIKKKLLFIGLFIFAIVGIAGYGVYSYYWAEGNVTVNSPSIVINKFNPSTNYQSEDIFIGDGIESYDVVDYLCENIDYKGKKYHCTTDIAISNLGDKTVVVEVTDLRLVKEYDDYNNATIKNLTSSDSIELAPGETSSVSVSGDIVFEDNYDQEHEVSSPIYNEDIKVWFEYKIKATETH